MESGDQATGPSGRQMLEEQPTLRLNPATNNEEKKTQPLPFPWNTTELSLIPRQSTSRFTSKAQELFESKRKASVDQFISDMNQATRGDNFVDEAELKDLLNATAESAINSFRKGCGKVHSVDREAEKLTYQLDQEKEKFRAANDAKIEGHKAMLNEEIVKLRMDFEIRVRLLLDREDVVTMSEYLQLVESTRKAVENFQAQFQTSQLFETINEELSAQWKTVYPVIKGLIEDHNLGIEMEEMKADVKSKYEKLTSSVKDVEDLQAAHSQAMKMIERVCKDKKEVYKFADIPIFIEDLRRAKVAELEQKSRQILAELNKMYKKAMDDYKTMMEKELGIGRPVQQPVLTYLNKKYRKQVMKEFGNAFAGIQDEIKDASQLLDHYLETLKAELAKTYRIFQDDKDDIWTQYKAKVDQALEESEEFCAVEMLKVGQPNGYLTVEEALTAAEMKFDKDADLKLFEPRYVTDARDQLRALAFGVGTLALDGSDTGTAPNDGEKYPADFFGSSQISISDDEDSFSKASVNVVAKDYPVNEDQIQEDVDADFIPEIRRLFMLAASPSKR